MEAYSDGEIFRVASVQSAGHLNDGDTIRCCISQKCVILLNVWLVIPVTISVKILNKNSLNSLRNFTKLFF